MNPQRENDSPEDEDDDADISTVPFVQQRAFGRGLWKDPINFVSASSDTPVPKPSSSNGQTIAEKYLAIMFPDGMAAPEPEAYPLCAICSAPVKESDHRIHYLSPTHQAALPRAPTPSSIDRTRMGLMYMKKYGYDVDARRGLGANGQGMLFPLMPKEKRDRFGLGVDRKEHVAQKALGGATAFEVREGKLDAGRVRKLAGIEKKKHEKLQKMFYGNDEVEKYLGQLNG